MSSPAAAAAGAGAAAATPVKATDTSQPRIHTLSSLSGQSAGPSSGAAAAAAGAGSCAVVRDTKGNIIAAAGSTTGSSTGSGGGVVLNGVASRLTSEVYEHPDRLNWWDFSLVVPHEALRHDLTEMLVVLQPSHFEGGAKAWKVNAFFRWFRDSFVPHLTLHSEAEESIYLPALRAKGVPVPPELSADHKALDARVAAVNALEAQFMSHRGDATALAADAQALLAAAQALDTALRAHMTCEEQTLSKVLPEYASKHAAQRLWTEEDEGKCVSDFASKIGVSGAQRMLPWLDRATRRWAGNKRTDELITAGLPAPVKTLHTQYWRTEETATNTFVLQSIKAKDKPKAEPSQRCCGACRWFSVPDDPAAQEAEKKADAEAAAIDAEYAAAAAAKAKQPAAPAAAAGAGAGAAGGAAAK